MYGIVSVAWSALIIYISYLFLIYIVSDAFVQLGTLIGSVISITGMSVANIGGVLISIGIAVGSLGLLTFVSLRLYAMTYLPLKSMATRAQRIGGKALPIDRVYLSAFFLMPVLFPSLRENALKKLQRSARRISQDASVVQEGELVTVRMSLDKGAEKTFNQLRTEVIRYENTLREDYNLYVKKLLNVMQKDDDTNEFYQIDRVNSRNAASLLKRSDFLKAFNERTDKVYSNIGQLLESFVCFIWSVDMQPEVFARLNPKDFEYSFLEDISTSTTIYDVGTFRRERIIGSKNIENILKGMSEYFNTAKENPQFMQTTHAAVLYEPIKNRLMIFGRAKRVESLRKVIKRIFLVPTRSTLETASLQDLSTSLLRLSQFIERTPTFTGENIRATEYKELKLINSTLNNFDRSLKIVEGNIQAIQHLRETVHMEKKEAEKELDGLDYDVALLGLVINVGGQDSDLPHDSRVSCSALLRQNRRLSEKLESLKTKVTAALRRKEIDYRNTLRRIGLLTLIGLIISVPIAFYLRSMLLQLGAWNLLLLSPIAVILLVGFLSLRRAQTISGKAHSPIIDSLLLLSNHYSSLASEIPSVSQLLNQIA
jgi:tetratricopeptide (TPR) repeat protein